MDAWPGARESIEGGNLSVQFDALIGVRLEGYPDFETVKIV